MKKYISALSLLLISLSSMIGSGWLFGSLYSAHYAGPAAILAWPLAAFLLMFVALSYAEVASMFPHGDNVSMLPMHTHGRLTSVIMSGFAWITLATMPVIETQGLVQYASNYIPGLMTQSGTVYTSTPVGFIFALVLLMSFVLFNYFGVRLFAKINSGFTVWKFVIPTLTVVTLFAVSYHPHNSHAYGGFMPYGWQGVMMAMSSGGALFSFLGFRQIIIMMGAVQNAGKTLPLVIAVSLLLTAVLYTCLQWSFITSLSPKDLTGGWAHLTFKGDAGPFAALASLAGVMWLSVLLYADAFVSPYSTALVFSTTAGHLLASMGKVGNAPQVLNKRNKHQAPWLSLSVNFLLAVAMFFVLRNWQSMAAFIVAVQIVSYATGPISLVCLRKQMPNHPRPFRLWWGGLIAFIGFYVCTAGAYWCGWHSIHKFLTLFVMGLLFYLFYHYKIKKSPDELNAKNATWLLYYLLGIGVFSYFGNYGGAGAIPLYWDLLYLLAFSLIIFLFSVYTRLESQA